MQTLTFKRGVHPHDGKALTKDEPIKVILPKEDSELFFPMSQHIGAPCEPIVQVGDYVKVGQKIGEAKAFVCSPIFSSISGTVTDIRPMLTPGGAMSPSIVIKNDGKMEEIEGLTGKDYQSMSNEEIISAVKEAGVVGLGGAGFPTHIKLAPPPGTVIDYVLINAAECEPYLTCDYRLMLEQGEKLIKGLQIVLKLHPNAKGVIGIEDNKPDAIKHLSNLCKDIPNIEVATLKAKFPQGSEKHLIKAITNREVPSGALPSAVGCIVDNVDTIISVYNAIAEGTPLMRRVVTITGGAPANPGNYQIRIGMTFTDLLEQIGGFKVDPAKMIAGGPMMGPTMYTTDVATTKTTSALLCFTPEEAVIPEESNCIRCGKCVSHCPMGLMPYLLNAVILQGNGEAFCKENGLDCIECGSCSYICPAKRQLAQSIRATKKVEMGKKAAAAAAAAKAAAAK
ncbi:MAG: electron transport complex subunit RsxC [Lachnospiraceae bacterium]|nr:electron transport complex subunit RsxC [Lachnospiraceae bacterium]